MQSIVQLGHNLGLIAVAEGVEDPTVLAALVAMGCDVAQGYHFSRPLAPEGFASWLTQYRAEQARPVRPPV